MLKKIAITLAVVVAIVAAAPLLFPYDHYKTRVEEALKARIGIDTKIGQIRFGYEPVPTLFLEDIEFGRDNEGKIGQVRVPITWKNLFNFRTELHRVVFAEALLREDFARSLPGRLKPSAEGDIHLATVKLERLTLQLPKSQFGPLSGGLQLNSDGTFKEVTLTDSTGVAEATIKPKSGKFSIDFQARNWTLPGKHPVPFDHLTVRGVADANGAVIDDIRGQLFSSVFTGTAQIDWQTQWQLSGTLETKSLQVEPLILVFNDNTRASGRMAAAAQFLLVGDSYENLFTQPQIAMNFAISNGNLHNLDLVGPLKSQGPTVQRRGGQTTFETLTGVFKYDQGKILLQDLKLDSGKFKAQGNLTIAGEQDISGRISAQLKSGSLVVQNTMTVAGKLNAPELHSGGTYKPGGGTTQIF
ncbi:AsmA-like C-terminal region-containing protein [Chitinimonas lacunae]|uniref:AsmA-like C-terminal region-containing protein n=1 Tax=Chitinimonas lacunae TaxID=1963018 RepID=A0ABV8MQM8_9NEIS